MCRVNGRVSPRKGWVNESSQWKGKRGEGEGREGEEGEGKRGRKGKRESST